jgi:hypothetical protein
MPILGWTTQRPRLTPRRWLAQAVVISLLATATLGFALLVPGGETREAGAEVSVGPIPGDVALAQHVHLVLQQAGVPSLIEGSIGYDIRVPRDDRFRAMAALRRHARSHNCSISLSRYQPATLWECSPVCRVLRWRNICSAVAHGNQAARSQPPARSV